MTAMKKKKKSHSTRLAEPAGYILLVKETVTVDDFRPFMTEAGLAFEIWPPVGVIELILGEKQSLDIETILPVDMDLQGSDEMDEALANRIDESGAVAGFYLNFGNGGYDKADALLRRLIEAWNGLLLADKEGYPQVM
ncbi:MAG: hypothetical protein Q4B73_01865 [Lachnospiraceae bacterium]|nr:hypothetical protein [Lachnospiraceae bacterium]